MSATATCRCRPTSPTPTPRTTSAATRPCSPATPRRRGRTHRRAAFRRGCAGALLRAVRAPASRCTSAPAPSSRCAPRTSPSTPCTASGTTCPRPRAQPSSLAARAAAGWWRSAPPPCARSNPGPAAAPARIFPARQMQGDTTLFITSGLSFPGGRRAAHQLPPAQEHADDAGQRLCRLRAHHGAVRACHRAALPLLQLWRRDVAHAPHAEPAQSPSC
jgi:hypothetical protein